MKRSFLLICCLSLVMLSIAESIPVKNIDELNAANRKAQPGDIIILQNGEWKDVIIKLNCTGTAEKPIQFKAQMAGKVIITGRSQLRLGGNYITVDGFYFTDGYTPNGPVISYRIDSKEVANNCRITNTSINNFNNPKRMEDNNWVAFYGKNNRLDHCSFKDKNNMGVVLVVILDDDRSRENFHSIDHNYFGRRLPLGSNGGEIIRVGVSQHCEFNSNTQITDNFFEYCDGETEIISIKSGSNVVRGNVFKESQGSVVLRHGNYNTVENNLFLGNGKTATGGVRVINKGQWVVNNFFYKCRGQDFRSPLAIMNGIPNSPAHRYVQVTDAVIANNTFYDCAPISFGEGSDAERTLPPANTLLINNIFYNNTDSIIYRAFDDINGINFIGNEVSTKVQQDIVPGFNKVAFAIQTNLVAPLPLTLTKGMVQLPDSIHQVSQERLKHFLSIKPGFADVQLLKKLMANATNATGAKWFKSLNTIAPIKTLAVKCSSAEDVYKQLEGKEAVIIQLTNTSYTLTKPFVISKKVQFTGMGKTPVAFSCYSMLAVFVVSGKGNLSLEKLTLNGGNINATHLISSDSAGSSDHYNVKVTDCKFYDMGKDTKCKSLFHAYKSMIADSIIFENNQFTSNTTDGFIMADEKADKGYYNAEKIRISNNSFSGQQGTLLNLYRGGNDESTLGPNLLFSNNKLVDCHSIEGSLMSFTGIQVTTIINNDFTNANPRTILVSYKDSVRARHLFQNNKLTNSGTLEGNIYLTDKNNVVDMTGIN